MFIFIIYKKVITLRTLTIYKMAEMTRFELARGYPTRFPSERTRPLCDISSFSKIFILNYNVKYSLLIRLGIFFVVDLILNINFILKLLKIYSIFFSFNSNLLLI